MYHVIVRQNKEVIAQTLLDGLAEAVNFGREESSRGDLITIYDSLRDSAGNILHLNKVLSMIFTEDNHRVYP
jgi:hypothetical protein